MTPSFARKDGGPSEMIRGILPEFARLGVDIEVVTTDKGADADDLDFARDAGLTVTRSRRPRSWNFSPGIVKPLWRMIKATDIVHIHSVNTFTTTVSMLFSRMCGKPYLLEPHGAFDSYHMAEGTRKKEFYNKIIDRWGYRSLRGVFTSSDREATDAARVVRAEPFPLPLGVDESLFSLDPRPEGTAEILFLGRIAKKKRFDKVIDALVTEPAASSNWILNVAGPVGDDLDYDPRVLVEDRGLADRVRFLGQVGSEQRRELLSTATLFVLLSDDESFGVSVAEAMAAQCAVIATSTVGIAPKAHEASALCLAAADRQELSIQIAGLLRDNAGRGALARNGRAYARRSFRWRNCAEAAVAAYRSVLDA